MKAEHILRAFENKAPEKICELKGQEVTGKRRKLHNASEGGNRSKACSIKHNFTQTYKYTHPPSHSKP
jgi:hypothetical protein